MGSSNETSYYGPVGLALAAAELERREGARRARRRQARPADARRLVGRLGGGGGGAPVPRRDGDRHRRLDPPARRVHRHRRASSRPTAAARAGASSPSPPRSIRPGRSRAPCATARSCCARWPAHDPKDSTCVDAPVPDYEAAVGALGQGPDDRHSAGISARRHDRRRSRRCGGAASTGCSAAGAKVVDDLAAQHAPRAARLLHRRAGRGLVATSRATTACATACASRAPTSSSSTRRPAPRVSAPRCAGAS